MQEYEKLGVFYLGRYHHLATRKTLPDLLLYDSNDLLTHALCVGMTGSGKTGLCLNIIEEAAMDGIPAILIDPKGDLCNLLLTFPELRPADFEPWVNSDEARRKGLSVPAFAEEQAERWRAGLATWEQDGERIRRLRDAAEFVIYTPGSNAGLPVSILKSFAVPSPAVLQDSELLRERIQSTVSGLLGLLRIEADPNRGRESIFLANVLQRAWAGGRDLDLGALIHEVQSPSVQRIGVMDVDTFFPGKDRFALATAINGLLASPGFGAWLEGEPLDVQRLYYTPEGKPRAAIFSIAHLNDAERMFFVTLLLNQVLAWMRSQPGTTSLRALVYMDEIFGFFPPVANPPSKLPLLTLLKQGRAFGLGTVLATQNPVDLDYKGLANIGTWFLGRLQTERDKQRVLDGLEGAAASQQGNFNRAAMERTLAGLGSRVFLLHNVHEEEPAIFESRWAMSYLRGPMTRNQIKAVMEMQRAGAGSALLKGEGASPDAGNQPARPSGTASVSLPGFGSAAPLEPGLSSGGFEATRPSLPPSIPQCFVPARVAAGNPVVYVPMLLGGASVRFADGKTKVDVTETVVLATTIGEGAVPVDWNQSEELAMDLNSLESSPVVPAEFAPLPSAAAQAKNYAVWQKDFVQALVASRKLALFRSPTLNPVSQPGESEGDFRVRLSQVAREQRAAAVEKLRAKYAPKIAVLNERLRRAEQAVEREKGQARSAALSTAISFGSTILGAFLGRKRVSAGTLNKAGSALRGVGRSVEQTQDVARAGETVEALKRQLADLDAQFQSEAAAQEAATDPVSQPVESIELRPNKTNIQVRLLALAWFPHTRNAAGQLLPAFWNA